MCCQMTHEGWKSVLIKSSITYFVTSIEYFYSEFLREMNRKSNNSNYLNYWNHLEPLLESKLNFSNKWILQLYLKNDENFIFTSTCLNKNIIKPMLFEHVWAKREENQYSFNMFEWTRNKPMIFQHVWAKTL